MNGSIDVLKLHQDVIDDYKTFVGSFIYISDRRIREKIEAGIREGKYWPEPLVVFNPSFQEANTMERLVSGETLHPVTGKIFEGFRLYRHQEEAIYKYRKKENFVVTSGTGSGKSLCFLAPVFDYIIRKKFDDAGPVGDENGIKAIIVYPMNALINSQMEEIQGYCDSFKERTGETFPVTFDQYTGQSEKAQREKIKENLPNILLTNYMMLEYILTRPGEDTIRQSIFKNLKFLVFDELHTYRGRQGADVSLLVARIRAQSSHDIRVIGTSATMISGDVTIEDQKKGVAEVATKLLGGRFTKDDIINEYLKRCFPGSETAPPGDVLADTLRTGFDMLEDENRLKESPMSLWLENRVALDHKKKTLVRGWPSRLSEIAEKLAYETRLDRELCSLRLKEYLNRLARINERQKNSRSAFLPFKIHQFISQTGTVYASLHRGDDRIILLEPASYAEVNGKAVKVFPVVFSRTSGHEMICVTINDETGTFHPREFRQSSGEEEGENRFDGYLIPENNPDDPVWNPATDLELLPSSWIKTDRYGNTGAIKNYQNRLPREVFYDALGRFSTSPAPGLDFRGWFMTEPLYFDPTSGVVYGGKTGELTKLTRLGSEGRSTSTTILSLSILKHLARQEIDRKFQKLLSFTDNRQDGALQAGHFNDFINVARLRSAIYKALKNRGKLEFIHLGTAILDALNLAQEDFAANPSDFPAQARDNEQAFKTYLIYQALYDLRRSWRVVLPNLEQCAMLEIHYRNIDENCQYEPCWKDVPLLGEVDPVKRKEIVHQVLDYFRKAYALHSTEFLSKEKIDVHKVMINERLREPWRSKDHNVAESPYMRYETLDKKRKKKIDTESIGSHSALGKYLKSEAGKIGLQLKGESYLQFIASFMKVLANAGWLTETFSYNTDGETTGLYRLNVEQIIWTLGDNTNIPPDLVRARSYKSPVRPRPNSFFQELYQTDFARMKPLVGKEHTGMLQNQDRQEREKAFREGKDSILFCSPTMELGIDIKQLSVVHMRNVPPSTSNYVQRSGRAGRQGQAALVVTNCSGYSPHDRHYFNEQRGMVAGVVEPPKMDLDNRELMVSHLNAIYLAKTGISGLNESLLNLVDNSQPGRLPLRPEIEEKLKLGDGARREVKTVFKAVAADIRSRLPEAVAWINDEWIESVMDRALPSFKAALARWQHLYLSVQQLIAEALEIKASGRYPTTSHEMRDAKRNEYQAMKQRDILTNKDLDCGFSDFYPYRYLASEGFLPGYNFPRLPFRVYICRGDSGEYVSRHRFIALREFGPNNIIYHKGKKYKIDQLILPDIENRVKKAKISKNSGYILMDDHYGANTCPFTNMSLTDGSSFRILMNLVPMAETRAVETSRISCEEEERTRRGYDIDTYFCVPGGMHTVRKAAVKNREHNFLNLSFIPAAQLVQVNKKWRNSRENGFLMGMTTGFWKAEPSGDSRSQTAASKADKSGEENKPREESRRVMLFTHDTADALYIEPIKALGLDPDGVVTLMVALKRAIENYFRIESREIDAVLMGDEAHPNIFIYESAEGSLGILSQFMNDEKVFREIIGEVYSLCRFNEEDYHEPASYDDLLDYYNQRYHERLDRFLIKDAVAKLRVCSVEIAHTGSTMGYDERYRALLAGADPNSAMEKEFLRYLYRHGLQLPDAGQRAVSDLYCRPDFYYEPGIHIFCDGTPHDDPKVKETDAQLRKAIRRQGGQVLTWNYKEKLEDFIARRPDIFKKVR